jgi:hypothetical protein
VGLRYKCNDSIVQQQFQLLLNLFRGDSLVFISQLGLNFLITFGTQSDSPLLKDVRRLLFSYKQRDALLAESKKSFFYSFFFKALTTLYQIQDVNQFLKFLNLSQAELTKQHANEKAEGNIISTYSLEDYARVKVCQ